MEVTLEFQKYTNLGELGVCEEFNKRMTGLPTG